MVHEKLLNASDFVIRFFYITGGDDKFIIVSSTGEIRTAQSPLDREEKSVYHLIAVAKDRGNKQVRFRGDERMLAACCYY